MHVTQCSGLGPAWNVDQDDLMAGRAALLCVWSLYPQSPTPANHCPPPSTSGSLPPAAGLVPCETTKTQHLRRGGGGVGGGGVFLCKEMARKFSPISIISTDLWPVTDNYQLLSCQFLDVSKTLSPFRDQILSNSITVPEDQGHIIKLEPLDHWLSNLCGWWVWGHVALI